jgi:hypothetical protein
MRMKLLSVFAVVALLAACTAQALHVVADRVDAFTQLQGRATEFLILGIRQKALVDTGIQSAGFALKLGKGKAFNGLSTENAVGSE